NDAEAQTLFTRGRDIYLYVWVVAEPNTDVEKLAERISTVIPDGFEAVSGKKATEQVGSQVSEALGFFNQFLLVFAAISVLVSSFLIVNTFNILVAQRARELALLRAIGAKRRQVRLVVLVEAIIIGLIAGSLGLLLGLGLVWLIEKIFVAYELLPKPVTPTINSAAVIASYSVGLIVTLFSALLPAIRASRVPPVAAMTGQGELDEKNIGKIGWFGLVLLIVGLITVDVGGWLQSDITWWLIGGGALLALIGTAFSAALLGAPIVWLLGKIFGRTHGEIAVLAKRNVTRQPRRLASTSSSLIIGLALVSTIAVIGSSAEKTIAMKVTENIRGDLQVASVNFQPFDAVFADEIEKISGATTHRMKIAYTLVG
ncbi:MAG: ABC transporter, partial [Propionibacterium sp.]